MKKLLYVSTLDHIIHVMLPHLDGARAAGYRVEVACRVTRFGDEVLQHADALYDVPLARFPFHPANVRALRQLVALIRRERYDVVHAHNPTGGVLGRLAATCVGTGSLRVYTAHGFHFHRHGGRLTNSLFRGIERFAGQNFSDAVLTINEEDFNAAREQGVVPEERLFLTRGVGVSARDDFNPATVTAEERAAIRREIGAQADTPVIASVGEMIPRKRQFDAITAMAAVVRKFPGALLVLVGDGAQFEENRALAARLGVADSCRFLGFRRDVRTILAASDVFAFPSQQEGLPCAIQEALSMELPTVATDVRGNRDLVDDTCGRIVPLAQPDALAAAMIELLTLSEAERRALGRNGREKMIRLYDRPACVADWLRIYDVAAERRDRRNA